MPFLLVFNRVYRLEIQSVMWVFSTGFVKHCPSALYTCTVCKGGGRYGVIGGEGASDR